MNGHLRSQIAFPSWLGKNSTTNKRIRLMQQLASHARLQYVLLISYPSPSTICSISSTAGDALIADYIPMWRLRLTQPLVRAGKDGVEYVFR
jgi:replication factor C subunit 1